MGKRNHDSRDRYSLSDGTFWRYHRTTEDGIVLRSEGSHRAYVIIPPDDLTRWPWSLASTFSIADPYEVPCIVCRTAQITIVPYQWDTYTIICDECRKTWTSRPRPVKIDLDAMAKRIEARMKKEPPKGQLSLFGDS